jgi:hypothetical protein
VLVGQHLMSFEEGELHWDHQRSVPLEGEDFWEEAERVPHCWSLCYLHFGLIHQPRLLDPLFPDFVRLVFATTFFLKPLTPHWKASWVREEFQLLRGGLVGSELLVQVVEGESVLSLLFRWFQQLRLDAEGEFYHQVRLCSLLHHLNQEEEMKQLQVSVGELADWLLHLLLW